MDFVAIGNFISTVGFPVGLCLMFIYAFYHIGQALYKMWKEDIKPTLDSVKDTQLEFVETLKDLDCRVGSIENDVDIIKTDMSIIKTRLEIKQ